METGGRIKTTVNAVRIAEIDGIWEVVGGNQTKVKRIGRERKRRIFTKTIGNLIAKRQGRTRKIELDRNAVRRGKKIVFRVYETEGGRGRTVNVVRIIVERGRRTGILEEKVVRRIRGVGKDWKRVVRIIGKRKIGIHTEIGRDLKIGRR